MGHHSSFINTRMAEVNIDPEQPRIHVIPETQDAVADPRNSCGHSNPIASATVGDAGPVLTENEKQNNNSKDVTSYGDTGTAKPWPVETWRKKSSGKSWPRQIKKGQSLGTSLKSMFNPLMSRGSNSSGSQTSTVTDISFVTDSTSSDSSSAGMTLSPSRDRTFSQDIVFNDDDDVSVTGSEYGCFAKVVTPKLKKHPKFKAKSIGKRYSWNVIQPNGNELISMESPDRYIKISDSAVLPQELLTCIGTEGRGNTITTGMEETISESDRETIKIFGQAHSDSPTGYAATHNIVSSPDASESLSECPRDQSAFDDSLTTDPSMSSEDFETAEEDLEDEGITAKDILTHQQPCAAAVADSLKHVGTGGDDVTQPVGDRQLPGDRQSPDCSRLNVTTVNAPRQNDEGDITQMNTLRSNETPVSNEGLDSVGWMSGKYKRTSQGNCDSGCQDSSNHLWKNHVLDISGVSYSIATGLSHSLPRSGCHPGGLSQERGTGTLASATVSKYVLSGTGSLPRSGTAGGLQLYEKQRIKPVSKDVTLCSGVRRRLCESKSEPNALAIVEARARLAKRSAANGSVSVTHPVTPVVGDSHRVATVTASSQSADSIQTMRESAGSSRGSASHRNSWLFDEFKPGVTGETCTSIGHDSSQGSGSIQLSNTSGVKEIAFIDMDKPVYTCDIMSPNPAYRDGIVSSDLKSQNGTKPTGSQKEKKRKKIMERARKFEFCEDDSGLPFLILGDDGNPGFKSPGSQSGSSPESAGRGSGDSATYLPFRDISCSADPLANSDSSGDEDLRQPRSQSRSVKITLRNDEKFQIFLRDDNTEDLQTSHRHEGHDIASSSRKGKHIPKMTGYATQTAPSAKKVVPAAVSQDRLSFSGTPIKRSHTGSLDDQLDLVGSPESPGSHSIGSPRSDTTWISDYFSQQILKGRRGMTKVQY